MDVLSNFTHRHHPVIYALLLFIDFTFRLDLSKQSLEYTDHVTIKSNSYHFDSDREKELGLCVTFYITVPNAGESSDDPVNCCNVIAFVI
jgi:hypothetical protein